MKKENKRDVIILISLVAILFVINYPFLDNALENFIDGATRKIISVDRVIDGDTIESNGTSIRLLGINSPERGEFYYSEAKEFLEEQLLGENVTLEFVGQREDKYYRMLAYVHFGGQNINVKMVENGFANYYFFDGRDKYSDELENAWQLCIENEINLCEKSENVCSSCMEIRDGGIVNQCNFACNINGWEIKGEGRDKVEFNGTLASEESREFELDLSDSGGSLFLRDSESKLAVWK